MKALFVGAEEASEILGVKECIEAMDGCFRAMARGEAGFPPRLAVQLPSKRGALGLMPGYLTKEGVFGVKATSVFPGNAGTRYESHQGAVLLFEADHGCLLGAVDAATVTRVRTGAASAVATMALARKDSRVLSLLGAGTQASSHLDAMAEAMPGLSKVKVWSRGFSHARAFAERAGGQGVDIEACEGAEEAVRGADVVCTVTASTSPVLLGRWLGPGTHVNAVGASRPPARELDSDAVKMARLFVDSRESARLEADDYLVPLREGAIGEGHVLGEIGDVLEGKVRGRTGDSDVTLFKSVGLAVEDVAAALFVYRRALELGAGAVLEFGAERVAGGSGTSAPSPAKDR
ncbi:MAG: ornithine cyclodeaminase family protein [Nitrososphaerota archaeon]|nr:ornithine cyclodeaminase family protein [Nitrososphaerota archaeon]